MNYDPQKPTDLTNDELHDVFLDLHDDVWTHGGNYTRYTDKDVAAVFAEMDSRGM